MSKPLIDIMNLNLDRYGKKFNAEKFIPTLEEELTEMYDALEKNDEEAFVDGACDAIVVLAGGLTQMGYNPHLVLKEVVKHISSREQDVDQFHKWKAKPELQNEEKWLKRVDQDPRTIYNLSFKTCKI